MSCSRLTAATTRTEPFSGAPSFPGPRSGTREGRDSGEGCGIFRWMAGLVGKRYKLLVVLWIIVFVAAIFANQVWPSSEVVSFGAEASLPQDTESAQAQRILAEQFPGVGHNSSALIVLVAANATSEYYRAFAIDLQAVIVAASDLAPGETRTVTLHVGGTFTVDRRIEHLLDPSNATIYAGYESHGLGLARPVLIPA